jgi:uncharacterized protein YeaO (DUF488 family)
MAIRVVRLGSPRAKGEGLRLGTVRRPPRGVPKREFASRDYYDLWLPLLAPSARLIAMIRPDPSDPGRWRRFERAYRAELARPECRDALALLAALSHQINFSVGCYCEDARRCHRSILREVLRERGARLARA